MDKQGDGGVMTTSQETGLSAEMTETPLAYCLHVRLSKGVVRLRGFLFPVTSGRRGQ